MKLRLAQDAAQALADASAEARRCRHAEVTREHVLGALVGLDALWPTVLPLRFYRRELASLVAARLADFPTAGGYRDATIAVPLSEGLEALLRGQQRGIIFSRMIRASDLLDALLDDPVIALLVAEARLDLNVLDDSIEQAKEIAAEYRHLALHPEHVFRVLIEERWLGRAIHGVGGDVDVIRSRLDSALETYAVIEKRNEIFPTKTLASLIQRAKAHARELRRPPTAEFFLLFALQHDEARRVFVEAKVEPAVLLSAVVHGVAPSTDEVGTDGSAEVVFYNDDLTTQEFVIGVLKTTFDLPERVAKMVMIHVHENGDAVVGIYPEGEARDLARIAMSQAREAGFPLRVEVRASKDTLPDVPLTE